jgi:hypothetical protein
VSLYLVPNEIMQIFVRQTVVMLNAIMFNVDRQNAIKVIFIAEFRKAECRYAKCRKKSLYSEYALFQILVW